MVLFVLDYTSLKKLAVRSSATGQVGHRLVERGFTLPTFKFSMYFKVREGGW